MVVVLVVAAGAAWESPAVELIGSHSQMVVLKRCVDVDELLAASTAGQADAAVVALDAPGLDQTAVEVLHRHQVRVVAIARVDERAPARASRIGVDALLDHTDLDLLPSVLEHGRDESAAGVVESANLHDDETAGAPGDPGRVIVVWGPAGAPGRTTVATSVAALLARRERTTLVDADPYGGSVAQHLGVLDEVSGLLSAARLTGEGALEAQLGSVQRALGSRLTVVTGLPRGERWVEVRAGVVEHLLEVASSHGHVVVDTGFSLEDDLAGAPGSRPGRNQLTLGALEVADEVLAVGTPDPVGLARLARGLADLRERCPETPIRVVVNRMRPGLGWTERDVMGVVGDFARLAGVHVLPDDRATADRALATGIAVADTGDGDLTRALRGLSDALVPAAPPRRRARRRHLVGRIRRRTADTARPR